MSEAYVTLATNDSYAFGAATLASSLRRTGTNRSLVCMVTTGVSPLMRECLKRFFDNIVFVDIYDSNDFTNLALLGRPELGCTFTKLWCWRLTDYKKCVFLDADCLVLKNIDELFTREEFSAAPDLGWPDCFNSGVYVFDPSEDTYKRLVEYATSFGSFDGGDQGLLNLFFSDWAHKDIGKHLAYTYNCAFSAAPYSYLPALKYFYNNLKVVHFLGALKPWFFPTDPESQPLCPPNLELHEMSMKLVVSWWDIYNNDVKSKLSEGIALRPEGGSDLGPMLTEGKGLSPEEEDNLHRAAWESGYVEFGGRDAFENIKSHIESVMAKPGPAIPARSVPAPIAVAAAAPATQPVPVPVQVHHARQAPPAQAPAARAPPAQAPPAQAPPAQAPPAQAPPAQAPAAQAPPPQAHHHHHHQQPAQQPAPQQAAPQQPAQRQAPAPQQQARQAAPAPTRSAMSKDTKRK